jgi:hypothetical protein
MARIQRRIRSQFVPRTCGALKRRKLAAAKKILVGAESIERHAVIGLAG